MLFNKPTQLNCDFLKNHWINLLCMFQAALSSEQNQLLWQQQQQLSQEKHLSQQQFHQQQLIKQEQSFEIRRQQEQHTMLRWVHLFIQFISFYHNQILLLRVFLFIFVALFLFYKLICLFLSLSVIFPPLSLSQYDLLWVFHPYHYLNMIFYEFSIYSMH